MEQLLSRFDLFVNRKLMEPVFMLVQRWFHWNRFQLIRMFGWLVVVVYVILTTLSLIENPLWTWGMTLLGMGGATLISFGVMLEFDPKLSHASDRFEEGGEITSWAQKMRNRVRQARVLQTPMSTLFIIAGVALLLRSMSVGNIFGIVFWVVWMIALHLWEVPDVNPKDRTFLFEPQVQRQRD